MDFCLAYLYSTNLLIYKNKVEENMKITRRSKLELIEGTKGYPSEDKIYDDIQIVIREIELFCKKNAERMHRYDYIILQKNISTILKYWCGYSLVGNEKSFKLKRAYQNFFTKLQNFLIQAKAGLHGRKNKKIAVDALCNNRTIYRYIGHNKNNLYCRPICLRFDDIFVSWSKTEANSNITNKLKYPYYLLSCFVPEDMYGIDLSAFDIHQIYEKEHEIVFPTREKLITEIKIFDIKKIDEDKQEIEYEEKVLWNKSTGNKITIPQEYMEYIYTEYSKKWISSVLMQ